MALRVYLVPVIGDGLTPKTARRAKYIAPDEFFVGGIVGRYQAMDYGNEPMMLVAAEVTAAEHTAIAANADVIAAPANLDNTIGANLATVQAALESVNLPADWITSGMTYRTVLRWIARLFLVCQRFQGLAGGRLFPAGITLASVIGDLSASVRQKLTQGAQSLGLDTSNIAPATTIRAALKDLGNQMTLVITLGGSSL